MPFQDKGKFPYFLLKELEMASMVPAGDLDPDLREKVKKLKRKSTKSGIAIIMKVIKCPLFNQVKVGSVMIRRPFNYSVTIELFIVVIQLFQIYCT